MTEDSGKNVEFGFLKELVTTPGVPGREDRVRKLLSKRAEEICPQGHPVHTRDGKDETAKLAVRQLYVDLGRNTAAAQVRLGDMVVFDQQLADLGSSLARRLSAVGDGAAALVFRRLAAPATRNGRACTARDVRQPHRCVLTAHPVRASVPSRTNLDQLGRSGRVGFPIRGPL